MKKKGAKRGEEKGKKEENDTGTVKRRCGGIVSVESFAFFSFQAERCGELW